MNLDNKKPPLYSTEWCRRQKYPSFSQVKMLRNREIGNRKEEISGSHFVNGSREFYNAITLTNCIHSKDRPLFSPISFSPDGNMLAGIHISLQNLLIYRYRGIRNIQKFKNNIFRNFFSEPITISFFAYNRSSPYILAKDCAFFTNDSKHLVIASTIRVASNNSRINNGIQQNNESMEPGAELENYKFYTICLTRFEIVDELKFEYDQLNFGTGVHMMDRRLVILSILHQTIYIYYVDRQSGDFIRHGVFGWTLYADLSLPKENPITEAVFTGFRQRFLTFLFKQYKSRGQAQLFLRHIGFYRAVKLLRMQLLTQDLLLLRMDIPPNRSDDRYRSKNSPFFVFFDVNEAEILGIYNISSMELFQMLESSEEAFRNGTITRNPFPTSSEHVGYLRKARQQCSNYGTLDFRRNFLNTLPFAKNASAPNVSPYLDPHMFHYDERMLYYLERHRYIHDQGSRIFNRKTKRMGIHFEPCDPENMDSFTHTGQNRQPLYHIILHPFEPFGICTPNMNLIPFSIFITYILPDSVLEDTADI